ncbi:dUTPase [Mammaliicoccus sciuri]|uniref:dUTPase n=1 Tax=Mammaliicoccus sciuri TaxID=1296 RepID=UPI001C4EAF89|nr:dUTPase [Mammaliicoccus sciuri]
MNKQLTTDQLKELLEMQKEFDSRIPTLNIQDSKVAYVVEFFEWFNTLETFKNWKKKPGKPLDVQLDELADMLAFGLSIANQCLNGIENVNEEFSEKEIIDFIEKANRNLGYENAFTQFMYDLYNLYDYDYKTKMLLPFAFAYEYYSIDQLITAYKKKMERNHARQDGKIDKDKGYV